MRRIIQSIKQWLMRPSMAMPPQTVQALMQELKHTRSEECDCDEALRLFDQFAEATLRGEDVACLMPLVQHHIELCADCREEFDALMRVLRASLAQGQTS